MHSKKKKIKKKPLSRQKNPMDQTMRESDHCGHASGRLGF
jgi:hypothetical protein